MERETNVTKKKNVKSTYEQAVCGQRFGPRPSRTRRKANHTTVKMLKPESHQRNALLRITGMGRKIRSILIQSSERLRATDAHISHDSETLFFWTLSTVYCITEAHVSEATSASNHRWRGLRSAPTLGNPCSVTGGWKQSRLPSVHYSVAEVEKKCFWMSSHALDHE